MPRHDMSRARQIAQDAADAERSCRAADEAMEREARQARRRAGKLPRIQLDEEELQAVIDFHDGMAADAIDSREFDEADRRKARAKELTELLRRTS